MKEIQLSKGYVALIDDEDFEYLSQFRWYLKPDKNHFYAHANIKDLSTGKYKPTLMHRLIMKVNKTHMHIDHIDMNGLNNQKSNLRICSNSDNSRNRTKTRDNTSGYKGVHWTQKNKKWRAMIVVNGKTIHLGYFKDLISAAKAYNEAAVKYFGEFANINKIG